MAAFKKASGFEYLNRYTILGVWFVCNERKRNLVRPSLEQDRHLSGTLVFCKHHAMIKNLSLRKTTWLREALVWAQTLLS